ncbi:Cytochrome b-c1 complex subunit [Wickerhamomyces ciferrii]|uniref:Cytochrome b-c1 complex subunit n=1 Tax=Wickerhamomyces ciferrii (strain ATCC 14091 / BCRC 22168 / CBS 111 / JCM 3599 / NBRC 0793 / NRRL Y-1031 F-60-10) TaxID=1206466 RepID=K0KYP8_WICCF|nr:Cytochrome b-c1 complex subunit [Wickerhamomyces ciferrii]CCH46203.1 Cytochrome b-c1 complex subunit [Wickerhamomyces ciferrii]
MVRYAAKPIYKTLPHLGKLNLQNLLQYTPNLTFWGASSMLGIFVFTEGVPIFQTTFYQKIPYFGQHWISNPDPQDLPQ